MIIPVVLNLTIKLYENITFQMRNRFQTENFVFSIQDFLFLELDKNW